MATTPGNATNDVTTGITGFTGTGFTGTPVTNHNVLVGGSTTSTITSVSPSTSGFVLTSNGVSADPSFQAASTGLTTATLITTFTGSGTWTKSTSPPTKYIEIIGLNSGGGGASGRKGVSTASGGGAGGAGGGGFYFNGPASVFNTSETVTIGGTSNGGLSQSSDLGNGNNGGAVNVSSFGNIMGIFSSPAPAIGGTATSAAGGLGSRVNNAFSIVPTQAILGGGTGNSGNGITPTAFTVVTLVYFTGTGGGGGAGYDLVTPRSGGNGMAFVKADISTVITAGGLGGSELGTINGGDGNIPPTTGGILMGGTGGGGGGGPSVGTVAGNGGNGAIPGGGGGGGSGGISTVANSGAGGNGARGQIWVIEHF